MISLTSVIPVTTTLVDLSNLAINITNAMKNGISIVLVIDNYSDLPNQALEDICGEFLCDGESFQIVRGKFGSPGKARNAGLKKVSSEFVAFWDADDLVNVSNITRELKEYGADCDFIVGSYEVIETTTGLKRLIIANKFFRRVRLIREAAIWRIVFKTSKVKACFFGTSLMGEDQLFLANSGVLSSRKSHFSSTIFYGYMTGIQGQLTSRSDLNKALRRSISEIFIDRSTTGVKNTFFRYLIALRVSVTLIKRLLNGLK